MRGAVAYLVRPLGGGPMTLLDIAALAALHDTTVAWAFRRELVRHGVSVRLPRSRAHALDHARAYEVTPEEAAWCMRHNRGVIGVVR